MPAVQDLLVTDDERDFYGTHYFDRLSKELGQPPLQERARTDLPDRCLYWLRALLKYKLPPARILELGSAHGGFVAMMRWTGFDATGLDLSPGLCDFARQTFNVPILTGPVESQEISPQSLDVIALMDVLEHLPDPVSTIRHCANLLRSDGIFFLQTPRYREGKTLEEMELENDAFLQQLLPDQHLYLFSKSSVALFLQKLGFKHVNFEPAIFSQYDMALVAGSRPFAMFTEQEAGSRLESQVSGRSALALLDLDNRFQKLNAHTEAVSRDSEERERGLHELTAIIRTRDARIAEVERMAEERLASLETMREQLEEIRRESEKRERGLHELTAIIRAQESRIAEVERVAEERLASLETMHGLAEEIRRESEKRERGLHELTAIIRARDARIAEGERVTEQVHATQSALSEALVREDTLRKEILQLKHETFLRFVLRRIRTRKPKIDATGS